MSTGTDVLRVTVTGANKAFVEEQVAAEGFGSADEYVTALVMAVKRRQEAETVDAVHPQRSDGDSKTATFERKQ